MGELYPIQLNVGEKRYEKHYGFHKKGSVVAKRAFFAQRSNLLAVKEIASGWKEHPALATTQKTGFVNYSEKAMERQNNAVSVFQFQ
ncbi:MAG: hypothetical protein IMZ50_17255 [Candidatus Atribacteria bacterium]|nr:hypothetical protein [Candidatus Atribacteria bacterium]